MGDTKYSKATNCLRHFFGACNVIFLVFGLLTLAVGVWGVVIAVDGNYEALTGGNLISGAVLLLVAGAITVFVSIIGFCGAVGMWRSFLVIYAVAVIVIVIIEIVGAILAFVFTEEANDEIRDNMIRAIRNYRFDDNSTDYDTTTNSAVETAQGFFECCGVDNYTDWLTLNPEAIVENSVIIPARCFCDRDQPNCNVGVEIDVVVNGTSYPNTINVWDRGCQTLLEDYLEGSSLINGVIGIVIAIIEISFAVLAFCLCGAVHKHQKNNYA